MVHASELLRNPVCLEKLSLQLELLFVCCCERNLLDELSGEAWQCSRSLCARYCCLSAHINRERWGRKLHTLLAGASRILKSALSQKIQPERGRHAVP